MTNALLVATCLLLQGQQDPARGVGSGQNVTSETENAATASAAISKISDSLRAADRGLSEGRTGGDTLVAQQKAIEELEKLIEAAKSGPRSSNPNSRPSGGSEQGAGASASPTEKESSTGQDPQGGTAGGRSDNASTSDENATAPAGSNNVLQRFRASVVRDAWGHLPERLRDQLLNVGSDKYLPKYDGLVRDYFESLAQPGMDDRERDPRVP